MNYRTILLLNAASLLEALVIKFLIDWGFLVCNLVGLDNIYDVIALVAVKNILTLGAYQIYFWPQRNHDPKKKILLRPTTIDRSIPAIPQAYWIYSPLYYIVFNLAFLSLPDYKITMLNAWLMLMHASFWFLHFPTGVAEGFREEIRKAPMDKATRFVMNLVHAHDSEDNACPSMHCAFAMFITFIIYPCYPAFAISFPILISLSCLVCKQHLIMDIIPGLILGGLHGWINVAMYQL
mmetsp:Transcript_10491/g.24309  ORF Transcript_10491/g.24309 Transcript_10491/m.24309 type:complete len:237 (+) Transcript_10491:2085-2795(+)